MCAAHSLAHIALRALNESQAALCVFVQRVCCAVGVVAVASALVSTLLDDAVVVVVAVERTKFAI